MDLVTDDMVAFLFAMCAGIAAIVYSILNPGEKPTSKE